MPGKQLGHRVDHNIRAVVIGANGPRRGEGVVHHQQGLVVRGDGRDPIKVCNPQCWVRNDFNHHQFGFWPHCSSNVSRIASVNKCALDAKAGQILGQQAQAAAIELIASNDMVACFQ